MVITKKQQKGILLVLFTALISGVSIFINSYGVKGFEPSVFAFAKNLVVGVALFAIILAIGQWKKLKELSKKQWLQLAGMGLLGGSIPFVLFFKGLQLTTGSTAGFIHKTLFIFVAVFALLFLKEKINKYVILGAITLLVGTYIFISPDLVLASGHWLILAATIFWAAENTFAKHLVKNISGSIVAFGRMFFGSLFILVFLALTDTAPLIMSMTGAQYAWIGITSIFLLLYVFTFYNAISSIKVTTATSILALGAPITLLTKWLVQGATISVFQATGMFFIVAGVATIAWFAEKITVSKKEVSVDERY